MKYDPEIRWGYTRNLPSFRTCTNVLGGTKGLVDMVMFHVPVPSICTALWVHARTVI